MPAICGFFFGGCFTLIGIGIGMTADRDSEKDSHTELTALEPGTELVVTMNDSSVVIGRFRQKTSVDPPVYHMKYDTARLEISTTFRMPALYATETLTDHVGNKITGDLLGFDILDDRAPVIMLHHADDDNPYLVRLALLESIEDSSGSRVDPREILRLIKENKIPVETDAMIVERDNTQIRIDPRDVSSIRARKPQGAWLLGACVGAVVDVGLIVLMIDSFRSNFSPSIRWE